MPSYKNLHFSQPLEGVFFFNFWLFLAYLWHKLLMPVWSMRPHVSSVLEKAWLKLDWSVNLVNIHQSALSHKWLQNDVAVSSRDNSWVLWITRKSHIPLALQQIVKCVDDILMVMFIYFQFCSFTLWHDWKPCLHLLCAWGVALTTAS